MRSRGGAAVAAAASDRAHADIPTPTWRRWSPSAYAANTPTEPAASDGTDDELDRDLSDEAYIRRHEPHAVEERRRWTGVATAADAAVAAPNASAPAAVASPAPVSGPTPGANEPAAKSTADATDPENSTTGLPGATAGGSTPTTPSAATGQKRARVSGVPKPCVPLYPTPLECWVAVQRALQRHRNEAGAVLDHRRVLRRRRRSLAIIEQPLHAYAALESTLNREKLKLRRVLNKRRAALGVAPLGKAKQSRSSAILEAGPGVSGTLTEMPPVATDASSGRPAAGNMAPSDGFSNEPSQEGEVLRSQGPLLNIDGSLNEIDPFSEAMVSGTMAGGVHSSASQEGSGLQTAATCHGPNARGALPSTSPARFSKSAALLEQAAIEYEGIESLFRSRSKRFLLQLKSLAAQAQCHVSRPATFANLQKDFAVMRKEEEDMDASRSGEESKETVGVYIQRSIDSSLYPALFRSFALRPGYRLHGGLSGLVEDAERHVDHESNDQSVSLGPYGILPGSPHTLGMPVQSSAAVSSSDWNDDMDSLEGFDLDVDPGPGESVHHEDPLQRAPLPIIGPSRGVAAIVRSTSLAPSIAAVAATAPTKRPSKRAAPTSAPFQSSVALYLESSMPTASADVSYQASMRTVMASSASEYSNFPSAAVQNTNASPTEIGEILRHPQSQRAHLPGPSQDVGGFMDKQTLQYASALPLPPSSAQHVPQARWVSRPLDMVYREGQVSALPMASSDGTTVPRKFQSTASVVQPDQTHEAFTAERASISFPLGTDNRETSLKLASDERLESSREIDGARAKDASVSAVEGTDDVIGVRQPGDGDMNMDTDG